MDVDWSTIASNIRTRLGDHQEVGSEALDHILGVKAIQEAVEIALDKANVDPEGERAQQVAEDTLIRMGSLVACEWARELYRTSPSVYISDMAVELILMIAHPATSSWIPEFLADPRVHIGLRAMDMIDSFIMAGSDFEDKQIRGLLEQAAQHPKIAVRTRVEGTLILLEPPSPNEQQDRWSAVQERANELAGPDLAYAGDEWRMRRQGIK